MPISRRGFLATTAMLAALPTLPARASDRDASRIVSVGGSVTETLYFLKQDSRLVGVDTTSVFPDAAASLPKVGYMRSLSVEGVLSLNPTLLLAAEGAGPPNALQSLRTTGLDTAIIPDARSVPDVLRNIGLIADIVNAKHQAETLSAEIRHRAALVKAAVNRVDSRPNVLFLMYVREGALLTAGRNTAAEAIVTLAGGRIAFTDFEGYKPAAAEAVHVASPDIILMMQHVADQLGGVEAIAQMPLLRSLPAARNRRIHGMGGSLLLGFGPRTTDAAATLFQILHGPAPDLLALAPLVPA